MIRVGARRRGHTRLIAALLVLLFAVPGAAQVAATASAPQVSRLDMLGTPGLQSVLRVLSAEARRGGAPQLADWYSSFAIPELPELPTTTTYVTFPVPDLDGDGLDDLLDLSFEIGLVVQQDAITARAGLTGRRLWRVPCEHSFCFPLPAKVGPGGGKGFLRLDVYPEGMGFTGISPQGRVLFKAAPPPTGQQVGPANVPAVVGTDGLVYFGGLLHHPGNVADDVLLSHSARNPALRAAGARDVVLLSLANGRYHRQHPHLVPGTDTVGVSVVGDVTGDRHDDYAVMRSGVGGRSLGLPGAVDAVDGRSDATVFAAAPVPTRGDFFETFAYDVGDLDGDRLEEFVVVAWDSEVGPDPAVSATPPGDFVTLIDPSEGGVSWTLAGSDANPIGDIDRDGARDLVVVDDFPREGKRTVRLTALSTGGRRLWESVPSTLGMARSARSDVVGVGPHHLYGDLQPDGVQELYFHNRGDSSVDRGVVDGRSGRTLYRPAAGEGSLYASLDGLGTDVAVVEPGTKARPGLAVRLLDGATRAAIATLAFDRGSNQLNLWVLPRGRGRCADFGVNIGYPNGPADLIGLQGSRLTPTWGVRRTLLGDSSFTTRPSVSGKARRCR